MKLAVPEDLPLIQGDEHQLCQVFTNLVINAFEALGGNGAACGFPRGPERWKRTTGTASEGPGNLPTLIVEIADDGPGIPAELKDRVFNAFFTTKAQGSGLGLAIVRKIVDAHDGRIDVASTAGQGTRFTVTLPVSAASDEWFQ